MASAISMAVASKLVSRYPSRNLVAIGTVMFAVAMYMLHGVTLDTGFEHLWLPYILRGASLGMLFVPLSLAALAGLQGKEMGDASGLFNLTRQWGGSVGIACLSTIDRFGPERYEGELFAGTNYRLSEMESAINVVQMRKLDGVVSRNHNVKMRVLGQLKTYREITPQKLNDPEGEVGYLLRFFPENPELSAKIATALKAEGIGCGTRGADSALDWHIYCDMLPLTKTSSAAHCDRGSCPVAESIWAREVLVNLNQWYSPEDCDAIANGINKVLSAYCTEDPAATKWV